jgi:hypothetical protein
MSHHIVTIGLIAYSYITGYVCVCVCVWLSLSLSHSDVTLTMAKKNPWSLLYCSSSKAGHENMHIEGIATLLAKLILIN